jgi:two-component system chemotaxis response regulator CheB
MQADGAAGASSGFVCPACGGVLWERHGSHTASSGAGELRFECRIGHRYDVARLWVEHCAARNRAVQAAARALAENAALARRLAAWTRAHGNPKAAEELEREADHEDRLYAQVHPLLEDLPELGRGGG